MAKSGIFLLFLVLSTGLFGQNQKKKAPIRCDTVANFAGICIPNAVYFEYTIVGPNGIIIEQGVHRNYCMIDLPAYKTGTVILCEKVVTSPQIGVLVRQPPRKFYIK